jgi:hypothetical protein
MFFDLRLTAYANSGGAKYELPPFPLVSLLNHVQDAKVAGLTLRPNKAQSEIFYLADIQIDAANSRASLLINRSDRDASNAVYSDPEENHFRNVPKQGKEGNDFSAHLVIKLNATSSSSLALLEVSPGLSSRKIEGFLNGLFRHCVRTNRASYQLNHPNGACNASGTPLKVTAIHKAEFRGHPSTQFVSELNQGVLESIELIDMRKLGLPWDTHAQTKEVSRSILLKSNPNGTGTNFQRVLDAVHLGHSREYASAKVKFKTETKIPRTVLLETEHAHLANDELFVKKETVSGFSALLESSYQVLHPEICGKMYGYLT